MCVWQRRNLVLGVSCFWQAHSVKCRCNSYHSRSSNSQGTNVLFGMANYYLKFIPHNATIMAPLRNLLKKETSWNWAEQCQASIEQVTASLTTSPVLSHFLSSPSTYLSCDATATALGAVYKCACLCVCSRVPNFNRTTSKLTTTSLYSHRHSQADSKKEPTDSFNHFTVATQD